MIALVDALLGDPTVARLVESRVYPQVMPDNSALPAVVFSVTSAAPQNSMAGHTGGLELVSVQVDCYSKSYAQAQTLADAIHRTLGTDRVVAGLKGFSAGRSDSYEDETQLHRVSMDFDLWKEGAPWQPQP